LPNAVPVLRPSSSSIFHLMSPYSSSTQMSTTNGMRSRSAVSISWEFIMNAPSPVATSTLASGRAILAPMAPGRVQAMVDRPLEIRQVLGS
jgi:hypothetical protein